MNELLLLLVLGVSIAGVVLIAMLIAKERTSAREARDELNRIMSSFAGVQNAQFEALRGAVEQRLERIQQDNSAKLEQMRQTVDEKLHTTLEKRLSESFKLVSERLELVHKGLGEMQTLAAGVGDLKRVLANVKTRGVMGEVQLAALLEQMLTPEQYETNVATRPGSRERVEFAIKLPCHDPAPATVWLPTDAKSPPEDSKGLRDAGEAAARAGRGAAARAREGRVRLEARSIAEKSVEPRPPPDFALLSLPFEGLYAEVLRSP